MLLSSNLVAVVSDSRLSNDEDEEQTEDCLLFHTTTVSDNAQNLDCAEIAVSGSDEEQASNDDPRVFDSRCSSCSDSCRSRSDFYGCRDVRLFNCATSQLFAVVSFPSKQKEKSAVVPRDTPIVAVKLKKTFMVVFFDPAQSPCSRYEHSCEIQIFEIAVQTLRLIHRLERSVLVLPKSSSASAYTNAYTRRPGYFNTSLASIGCLTSDGYLAIPLSVPVVELNNSQDETLIFNAVEQGAAAPGVLLLYSCTSNTVISSSTVHRHP